MSTRWSLLTVLVLSVVLVASALPARAQGAVDFSLAFSPSPIGPGSTSQAVFTITNNSGGSRGDLAFSATFAAEVTIQTPGSASTTCTAGTVTAADGGTTITLAGGTVGNDESCTVTVDVTAPAVDNADTTYTTTTGDLTSDGGNHGSATGTLDVDVDRPGVTKSFSDNTIAQGEDTRLTITVDNSANGASAFVSLNDGLPAGLQVSDIPEVANNCGGTFAPNPGDTTVSLVFGSVLAEDTCEFAVNLTAAGAVAGPNRTDPATGFVGGPALGLGFAVAPITAEARVFRKAFTNNPVPPGGVAEVEFTIENMVGADLSDGAFTDDVNAMLAGTTVMSPLPDDPCGTGSSLAGAGTGTLTLSDAAVVNGSSCTFSVSLQLPGGEVPGAAHTNTTSTFTAISAGAGDGRGGGAGPIDPLPAAHDDLVISHLELEQTFLTDPVGAGGTTTLQFQLTNHDQDDTASGVGFSDNLSQFLGGIAVTSLPANGFCGDDSTASAVGGLALVLTVTNASLDPGATCAFEVELEVPAGVSDGTYTNVITGFRGVDDGSGQTLVGSAPSQTLTVVSAPSLTLTIPDDPVVAGGTVTLQLDLVYADDESSAADATSTQFTVDLDSDLTGLAATGLPLSDVCGPGNGTVAGSSGDTFLDVSGITLQAGGTCRILVTLQVPADAAPGAYPIASSDVTATVSGVTATSPGVSDVLDVLGLRVAKVFLDEPALPGATTTLRFTIDNVTPGTDFHSIAFDDDVGDVVSGMTVVDTSQVDDVCGSGSTLTFPANNLISLSMGAVTASTSCTFDVELNVPGAAEDGVYNNITTAPIFSNGGDSSTGTPATDQLTIDNDLVLFSKEFTDDPVRPGETVTLRYTLTNASSNSSVEDIAFTDDLDAALAGLEAVGLPVTDVCGMGSEATGTDTVTFTGGVLAPEHTCVFDVTVQVPASVTAGGSAVSSTSTVTGMAQPENVAVEGNSASDTLTVSGLIDFAKAFDGPSAAGATVDLTFTLTNPSGSETYNDLAFTDDLEAVLSGLAVSGALPAEPCGAGSSLSGTSMVVLTGGSLGPGTSCTFTVTLQVPAAAVPGTYLNATSGASSGGTPLAQPATANLEIQPPPTFAKAFAPNSILASETSRATYTIDNSGSAIAATELAFTDILLSGLRIASPPDATNTCGGTLSAPSGGDTVGLTGGGVAAGGTCTVSVLIRADAAATYPDITGELTSSSGNSGTATATLIVGPSAGGPGGPVGPANTADLTLTLAPSDPIVAPGDSLDVTATVTNLGPDRSSGRIDFVLPEGVTASSPQGCASIVDAVCVFPNIRSGDAVDVTITTTHPNEGSDQLAATITPTAQDPVLDNNSATLDVGVSADGTPPPTGAESTVIDTAISVSGERFPSVGSFAGTPTPARWVVLARVDVFADALAGSVLTREGPLLFTPRDVLVDNTATEIARVLGDGGTVYLLGGDMALSAEVETALAEMGHTVVRLAGPSRVQTALAVADEARSVYGGSTVGIARAFGTEDNPTAAWADSVSGGGWAAESRTPIVLTSTESLHPDVADWLPMNVVDGGVTILGGTAAISEAVADELAAVTRAAGPERGATAAAIAEQLRGVPAEGARAYLLINGFSDDGWAYGLIAAGLSSDTGAPVLLTDTDRAPPSTFSAVASCEDEPVALRRISPASQLTDALLAELDAQDEVPCAEETTGDVDGDGAPYREPPQDVDDPAG